MLKSRSGTNTRYHGTLAQLVNICLWMSAGHRFVFSGLPLRVPCLVGGGSASCFMGVRLKLCFCFYERTTAAFWADFRFGLPFFISGSPLRFQRTSAFRVPCWIGGIPAFRKPTQAVAKTRQRFPWFSEFFGRGFDNPRM